MPYVSGFVGAVPTANKEAYIAHARQAWTLFEKNTARSKHANAGGTRFRMAK